MGPRIKGGDGEQARLWTSKYKEGQELKNELHLADTPVSLGHPRSLRFLLSRQHVQCIPGICPPLSSGWPSPRLMYRHPSPGHPGGVLAAAPSPVVHSPHSSQSGQALPFPLNPLQLEVGLPVALASEPAMLWALGWGRQPCG